MTQPKVITKDFVLLVIAHFMQALGYASMLLLPLYLDHLGASRVQIGVIMATASVGGLIARPAIGMALDVIGRKRTLYAGTLMTTLGMLMFLLIDGIGPLIFVVRVLVGVGTGALFTGYFALASDLIPESRRTQGIALFGVSGLVPLVVNPFAGQLGLAPPELRWFFAALGGIIFASILPLALVREPKREAPVRGAMMKGALLALRAPQLRAVWVGCAMLAGAIATFMAFATVAAGARGIERPAFLWISYASGAVVVRLGGGQVLDRLGPSRLFPPSILAMAGAALGIAYAQTIEAVVLAGLFAGLGHGLGFPLLTSQLVSRVPLKFRGSGLATLTAVFEIAALTATPLFGAIADASSDGTMFIALCCVLILSLLIWWPLEQRSRALVEK